MYMYTVAYVLYIPVYTGEVQSGGCEIMFSVSHLLPLLLLLWVRKGHPSQNIKSIPEGGLR